MKIQDLNLICLKVEGVPGYTVFPEKLTGIIVQVDSIQDAPKEIARSIGVMLKHSVKEGVFDIIELKNQDT